MEPADAKVAGDGSAAEGPSWIRPEDRAKAVLILTRPQRVDEYELCARLGIPSAAAIAHELAEHLPHLRRDRAFKIWVGSEIAKIMRARGYDVVQARGRVPWGNYFTYGAVWGRPREPDLEAEKLIQP